MEHAPVRSRRALFLGMRRSDAPPVAAIAQSCLALRNTACMVCRDGCSAGAIRFALTIGGARPLIEPALCTGCWDCLPRCPTGAIALAAEAPHG